MDEVQHPFIAHVEQLSRTNSSRYDVTSGAQGVCFGDCPRKASSAFITALTAGSRELDSPRMSLVVFPSTLNKGDHLLEVELDATLRHYERKGGTERLVMTQQNPGLIGVRETLNLSVMITRGTYRNVFNS